MRVSGSILKEWSVDSSYLFTMLWGARYAIE